LVGEDRAVWDLDGLVDGLDTPSFFGGDLYPAGVFEGELTKNKKKKKKNSEQLELCAAALCCCLLL
jgi:hypothetical protein